MLSGKQWAIVQGDAREVLAGMDDQSVHCVVTSPPYWGLRDYGLPPLLWGGEPILHCGACGCIMAVQSILGGQDASMCVVREGNARGKSEQTDRNLQSEMRGTAQMASAVRGQAKAETESRPENATGKAQAVAVPNMRQDGGPIYGQTAGSAERQGVLSEPQHQNSDAGRVLAHPESAEQLGAKQYKLEGRQKKTGGLHLCAGPTRPSDQGKKEWPSPIHSGTSADNGATLGAAPRRLGEGTSQECNQGRQPHRESSDCNPQNPQGTGTMPALSQVVRNKLRCVCCGAAGLRQIECEHEWGDELPSKVVSAQRDASGGIGGGRILGTRGEQPWTAGASGTLCQGQFCRLCGCWRGSLGLEPTIGLYVGHLVEVFREVKRVLRNDGTVFLNLGDSYASGKGTCFNPGGGVDSLEDNRKQKGVYPLDRGNVSTLRVSGLKPKDLVGMPWRVAFALQADGWYLRSAIIWAKPNPMPESVTDRCTSSYEHILLLTKSADYYYDNYAVRTPLKEVSIARLGRGVGGQHKLTDGAPGQTPHSVHKPRSNIKFGGEKAAGYGNPTYSGREWEPDRRGANLRDVWRFPTSGFPGAHFAVFPNALPRRCILLGTSQAGCCPECKKPWERIIERTGHVNKREPAHQPGNDPTKTDSTGWAPTSRATENWRPGCECYAKEWMRDERAEISTEPCIVLDPFCGSGTTVMVALRLGRRAIGIDLSESYCGMARKRIIDDCPMLNAPGEATE